MRAAKLLGVGKTTIYRWTKEKRQMAEVAERYAIDAPK
jgi:hypothetical protein